MPLNCCYAWIHDDGAARGRRRTGPLVPHSIDDLSHSFPQANLLSIARPFVDVVTDVDVVFRIELYVGHAAAAPAEILVASVA